MESEFIALDKSGEEAQWLRQFVKDIPQWPKPLSAICIHCDSESAIGRSQCSMYNGKSRHMRRRHNTIRQLLSTGVITIDHVRSEDNIANPLKKGLSTDKFYKLSRGMGLKPAIKEVWGKPNLADWRSQELSSIGKLNHMTRDSHCGGVPQNQMESWTS